MTKAERLDALLARLEDLPGRISSLAIGIGHLRARRAEQYDFTLQRLQGEANVLRDEMWELFLKIGRVRDGQRVAHAGPRIGRPAEDAEDRALAKQLRR